jgi:hypothetical protein
MFNIGDHNAVVLNNPPTFRLRKRKRASITENNTRNPSRPSANVANGIHIELYSRMLTFTSSPERTLHPPSEMGITVI